MCNFRGTERSYSLFENTAIMENECYFKWLEPNFCSIEQTDILMKELFDTKARSLFRKAKIVALMRMLQNWTFGLVE